MHLHQNYVHTQHPPNNPPIKPTVQKYAIEKKYGKKYGKKYDKRTVQKYAILLSYFSHRNRPKFESLIYTLRIWPFLGVFRDSILFSMFDMPKFDAGVLVEY